MIKLQCENCFSDLEPQRTPYLFTCKGCGVSYFLGKDELPEPPKYVPEGLVECPDGSWRPYCVYHWRNPKPPFKRYIGFLSQNYKREVELDLPYDILRQRWDWAEGNTSLRLRSIKERVKDQVMIAIKDLLPLGIDPSDVDLRYIFEGLAFIR